MANKKHVMINLERWMSDRKHIRKHLKIIKQGVKAWNKWRKNNPLEFLDFSKVDLRNANLKNANFTHTGLYEADLRNADLRNANFSFARLYRANLSNANLSNAKFIEASLSHANLSNANLSNAMLLKADLVGANLRNSNLRNASFRWSNLSHADLSHADLSHVEFDRALLNNTNLSKANLIDCSIYGIAVWDVKLNGAVQKDLRIIPTTKLVITVDNLEIAQFIYLLLYNEKIKDIIDTITSKVVLILGRFTPDRKAILDAIREELRKRNYLPVLFDFQGPRSRDITETVSTLAHMARFIIADITDAKSIPQELQAIVPNLPSVIVQPLLQGSKDEYGMFEHFKKYPWVLAIHRYGDLDDLITTLGKKVIAPIEAKALEAKKR